MYICNVLRLKEILKEKGITGKQLAEDVGVSENNMSRIVRGDQAPRFVLLYKIADVLDVDVRDLFHSTKPKKEDTLYIRDEDGYFVPVGKIKK